MNVVSEVLEVNFGALCTWEVADRTSVTELRRLLPARFSTLLPDRQRHVKSVLRDAIREYFSHDSSIVVRPQKSDDKTGLKGFSVFRETKHDPKSYNELAPEATVAVSNDGTVVVTNGDLDVTKLQQNFNSFVEQASASMISELMVGAVYELGGAGNVRTGGGIYFLPYDSVEEFKQLVAALTSAQLVGRTRAHMFMLQKDATTVASVYEAISGELKAFASEAEQALSSGTLRQAGLETQLRGIDRQISRAERFENLLGKMEPELKQSLEKLRQTALITRMTLSGWSADDEV